MKIKSKVRGGLAAQTTLPVGGSCRDFAVAVRPQLPVGGLCRDLAAAVRVAS